MTLITASDFDLEVRKGSITTYGAVQKFGFNTAINASEDLWSGTGAYAYLAAAEQLDFSSTALQDNSSGSGLQTLQVTGLDGTFTEIQENITMNGVANVRTTLSFRRGYRVKGLTWGSTGYNQGVITAVGATSSATVVVHVPQGTPAGTGWGQTEMAIYTIPAGFTGYMKQWYAGILRAASGVAVELGLWVRDDASSSTAGWRNLHVLPIHSQGNNPFQHKFDAYPILTEKTDVKIMCTYVSAANQHVAGGFDITLVKNSS